MSWSAEGSTGLATISCLKSNKELKDWTYRQTIPFRLIPALAKAA
jgi:hypothetical protein